MPMRRVLMAALVLLLAVGSTGARTLDQVPHYLKKEGSFVTYPAIAVGGLGAVLGGVIALPAALVAAPIGWAAGDTLGYTLLPISVLATGGAEAGYHLGGAIPWVLKNGLYDAPMDGIARIKGEPASGLVAQVDPPPTVTPVDIQYLASTPTDARVPIVPPRQYSVALPPPKEPTSLMLKRALSPFKLPPNTPGVPPARASVAPSASLSRQTPLSPAVVPPAVPAAAPMTAPAPTAVAPPPAPVRAPVRTAAESRPTPPPEDKSVKSPAPAASEPAPAEADDGGTADVERPSLKKKRKFSERFGF